MTKSCPDHTHTSVNPAGSRGSPNTPCSWVLPPTLGGKVCGAHALRLETRLRPTVSTLARFCPVYCPQGQGHGLSGFLASVCGVEESPCKQRGSRTSTAFSPSRRAHPCLPLCSSMSRCFPRTDPVPPAPSPGSQRPWCQRSRGGCPCRVLPPVPGPPPPSEACCSYTVCRGSSGSSQTSARASATRSRRSLSAFGVLLSVSLRVWICS